MKKFLIGLVLMVSGVLAVNAENAPKKTDEVSEVKAAAKGSRMEFSEIYANDIPEAIACRLANEGALMKEVYIAYQQNGKRVYKVVIMTSDLHEAAVYLTEDGHDVF